MSKQEGIRAGIQDWVDKRFGIPNTFNTQLLYDFLVYLDEHDVVVKVKGELPKGEYLGYQDVYKGYEIGQQAMLNAGYTVWKPLIKEGE